MPKNTPIELPVIEKIDAKYMKPEYLYIWSRLLASGEPDMVVVKLNQERDGLAACQRVFGRADEWYFKHNLVGALYGPFSL